LLELLKSGIDVNLGEQKSLLRKKYRENRRDLRRDLPYTHLIECPEIENAQIVASYISYGDEPNTDELNRAILESGKKLLLPRITPDSQEPSLDWVFWNGDREQLASRGKVLEPVGLRESNLALIDVVIAPALHIDSQGFRLGQGGGYYDRALSEISAWTVALIFPEETSEDLLPRESHDVAVNAYATYEKIVRFI
jgi:5-formyltetrahydrofolate cyclo-ligase